MKNTTHVKCQFIEGVRPNFSMPWAGHFGIFGVNKTKQAGANVCQAQKKLRLATLDLPIMKLYLSSIKKDIEAI